jgi:hypothetical protein
MNKRFVSSKSGARATIQISSGTHQSGTKYTDLRMTQLEMNVQFRCKDRKRPSTTVIKHQSEENLLLLVSTVSQQFVVRKLIDCALLTNDLTTLGLHSCELRTVDILRPNTCLPAAAVTCTICIIGIISCIQCTH